MEQERDVFDAWTTGEGGDDGEVDLARALDEMGDE